MMRRMVKEELLKFDGTPLFPERRAYSANYDLTRQAQPGGVDSLSMALFDACVDLNPHQIEAAMFALRSHGEKVSISFLLNVWNPGKFDVMDALAVWESLQRNAFCDWAMNPWWP